MESNCGVSLHLQISQYTQSCILECIPHSWMIWVLNEYSGFIILLFFQIFVFISETCFSSSAIFLSFSSFQSMVHDERKRRGMRRSMRFFMLMKLNKGKKHFTFCKVMIYCGYILGLPTIPTFRKKGGRFFYKSKYFLRDFLRFSWSGSGKKMIFSSSRLALKSLICGSMAYLVLSCVSILCHHVPIFSCDVSGIPRNISFETFLKI